MAALILVAGALFLIFLLLNCSRALAVLRRSNSAIRLAKGSDETQKRSAFFARYTEIDRRLSSIPRIAHAWQKFRETLISPEGQSGVIISNTSRPHSFFTPSALGMNFSFVRHVPNIFVGIGLLGTFLGLIAALTAALKSFHAGSNSVVAQKAITDLLVTASAKFYVSAAALGVSIILTVVIRSFGTLLSRRLGKFNNLLEERLVFASAENIAGQQLEALKEQSVQLRTFNTDLAMTIGQSIREAISDSNKSLIQQFQTIASRFFGID